MSILQIQTSTFWPVHCSHGVHDDSELGQAEAQNKGIRMHQYLDDWLVRVSPTVSISRIPRPFFLCICQNPLVTPCQELCWIVNMDKWVNKQVFDFVCYQFRPQGQGPTDP